MSLVCNWTLSRANCDRHVTCDRHVAVDLLLSAGQLEAEHYFGLSRMFWLSQVSTDNQNFEH